MLLTVALALLAVCSTLVKAQDGGVTMTAKSSDYLVLNRQLSQSTHSSE